MCIAQIRSAALAPHIIEIRKEVETQYPQPNKVITYAIQSL